MLFHVYLFLLMFAILIKRKVLGLIMILYWFFPFCHMSKTKSVNNGICRWYLLNIKWKPKHLTGILQTHSFFNRDLNFLFSNSGLVSASILCVLPSTDATLNCLDFCLSGGQVRPHLEGTWLLRQMYEGSGVTWAL